MNTDRGHEENTSPSISNRHQMNGVEMPTDESTEPQVRTADLMVSMASDAKEKHDMKDIQNEYKDREHGFGRIVRNFTPS